MKRFGVVAGDIKRIILFMCCTVSKAMSILKKTGATRPLKPSSEGSPSANPTPHMPSPGYVPLSAGTMVKDRFRIDCVIGSGGMGRVYRAFDIVAKRTVAVKEAHMSALAGRSMEGAAGTFSHEARLMASLSHPMIPRVHDFFINDSRGYIVMDYIAGETLEAYLMRHNGGLSEEKILDCVLQLCDVLQYLHGESPSIIFRDLKPLNILIDREGALHLVDFGIARRADGKAAPAMGTNGYAAPEQYRGILDRRSDLYAMGAVLHYMLTLLEPEKREPFSFSRFPIADRRLARFDWQPIVDGLTALDPEDRFASAHALHDALQRLALRGFSQFRERKILFLYSPWVIDYTASRAIAV